MALRDLIFQEGADVFARLRVGFVRAGVQQGAVDAQWVRGESTATTTVMWVPSQSVDIDGVSVLDGTSVVEYVPFVDSAGAPDRVRLLAGMEFEYTLTVAVVDG